MAAALAAAPTPTGAMDETGGRRYRVEIRHLTFVPEGLVVTPGDTVVWVNRDLVPHTLTAADGSWDSRHLAPHETWALRVAGGTTGQYFCRYHPTMRGHLGVSRDAQTEGGRP